MSPHDHVLKHWFGYEPAGDGGAWRLRTTPTTGFWIDYKGDVTSIVRKTLRWALEISLGLMPDEDRPGRPDPDPIEFFWMCNTNWFEGWGDAAADGSWRPDGHGALRHPRPHRRWWPPAPSPSRPRSCRRASRTRCRASRPTTSSWASRRTRRPTDHVRWTGPTPPGSSRTATTTPCRLRCRLPPTTRAGAPGTGYAQHAVYHGTDQTVIVSPSFPAGGVPYDHWIRT